MKPLSRSKGWFRSRIWPRIRKGEPLSVASIWILCSGCSFTNSFQDGCLGQVRITLPAQKAKSSDKPQRPPYLDAQTAQHKHASAHAKSWKASAWKLAHKVISVRTAHAPRLTAHAWHSSTQHADAVHEPEPLRWSRAQYRSLLPGVFNTLFVSSNRAPFGVHYPHARKTMYLRNGEARQTWRSRPTQVSVCYHKRYRNMGWSRYHMPRNTSGIQTQCQAGFPLGRAAHWFVVSDTFSATGMPCRVFFSQGRTHIVAQCGATLYRTPIARHAQCLQTGMGQACSIPSAALAKVRYGQAVSVEYALTQRFR